MEVYSSERRSVQWHIPIEYSSEMSQKSDVVICFQYVYLCVCHSVADVGTSWCAAIERKQSG